MKILSIIKGFVTNSSSANYWLNDEVLKDAELKKYLTELREKEALVQKEASTSPIAGNHDQNQATPSKISSSIFLFFGFFAIMITVLIIKRIKDR